MEKIIFNGRAYNAETVAGYYDAHIINAMDCYTDDPQEFFEEYLNTDPSFVDLFEYDFTPID